MSTSDLGLARRVLAGDEAALEEFFDRYFPRLFRFALPRVGGNEDATEDIVQRVLIRGLERLRTYRGEAALLTWLCALCRREIAAWREREGRLREVSFVDDRPDVRAALEALTADGSDDPETAIGRRELSALVQLTLDHLPGRYGDALEWKYIQGLSVDEIASRLGVGYKAAESLLTRARAAFRDGFSFVTSGLAETPRLAPRSEES
jgi:RNA polymerase sigma-70 factor, ECF subfamily